VCSVSPDRKLAIARAKHQLGFYLMHPVSDGPVATLGLQDAVADLRTAARANGPAAFVNTDERLVDAFSISGTPEEARQKLAEYRDIVPHVVLHAPYVPPFTAEESDDAYRNIITTFGPTLTP
jgi:alkanesulfonate monooxygenase SsuD/methylene tetrahydromethanopterin reductase-like flavin-dependent oxidoreductase (luciferase family)